MIDGFLGTLEVLSRRHSAIFHFSTLGVDATCGVADKPTLALHRAAE